MMAPTPKMTKMGMAWWERVVVQRSAGAVDAQVTNLTERSTLLTKENATTASSSSSLPSDDSESIAMLYREEIELGRLLGVGTYSHVYEVAGIKLLEAEEEDGSSFNRAPLLNGESRNSLETAVANQEEGVTQYAIKHLKPDLLKDTKTFEHAACDLIMEAKFLAQLSHPNILSMHGVAYGGAATYACSGLYDSFFIVVERIRETLSDRLRRWRLENISNRYTSENSTLAKIAIALQVADALCYLHEKRLVFRDLKPQNIGLTSEGIVQLFDFGFCRELPSAWETAPNEIEKTLTDEDDEKSHEHDDRLYGMSGKGTLMYMSPECIGTRMYNRKTDVYGWATIFYEMLTLQRPYTIDSVEAHRQAIYKRGERPPLHRSGIAQPIQKLLMSCWDGNIVNRFSMKEAKSHLEFINSEFAPSLLNSESFHHAVFSTRKLLLSPIQDVLATFANDVQTGCKNLIKDISGLPHRHPPSPTQSPLTTTAGVVGNKNNNKDSDARTHQRADNSENNNSPTSMVSLVSGLSFVADDDDSRDKDSSPLFEKGELGRMDDNELEVEPLGEEIVLIESEESDFDLPAASVLEVAGEVVADDHPEIEDDGIKEAKSMDGCPLKVGPSNDQHTKEESSCSKLLESVTLSDAPVQATGGDESFVEGRRRRRQQPPRSRNGTLVYHRFYGHTSLNAVGIIDEDQQMYNNLSKVQSLWSIHCVASAA